MKNNNNNTPDKHSKPAPSTQRSPFSTRGRNYDDIDRVTSRSESPNCTTPTTNIIFVERDQFEKIFNYAEDNTKVPFLFRELGLRLLYNSDNDNYYSDLRNRDSYQTDFTGTTSNTDYAHKLFSNIRNNHRYLKSCIKKGLEIYKTENEISFTDSIKIREYYRSKHYSHKGRDCYLDTLDQVVFYLDSTEYHSYETINSLISNSLGVNYITLLVNNFKKILKGEVIDDTALSEEQVKIIYTLFYHLFVIEGSRDPASYITIPLALEFLMENPVDCSLLLGNSTTSPGVIPICSTNAMQALSYMGDVIFKDLTSIQYSHSYNGTRDYMEPNRINQWETIQQRTNDLLKKYLKINPEDEFNPDSSLITDKIMYLCKAWYGFSPRMESTPIYPIQFFQQLGLIATDVSGDGNCFFYALSDLLNALPGLEGVRHDALRQIAARILNNVEIASDRQWTGLDFANISRVLAEHFQVNIVLVQQNTVMDQVNTMLEQNFYYGGNPNATTIYIGNIGNMHFVRLDPEEGEAFNQLNEYVQQHINNLHQAQLGDIDVVAASSVLPEVTVEILTKEPLNNFEDMGKAISESNYDELDKKTQDDSDEDNNSGDEEDDDDESKSDGTVNSAMEWIEENGSEDSFQSFEQRVADNVAATAHAKQYDTIAHAYRACCEGNADEEKEHALIAAYNGQYDNSDNEQNDEEDEYQDNEHGDQDDTIVNCLYNINYTNPSMSRLFDCNKHPDKEQYQPSAMEEHFLNNFVVNATTEKQYNIEQQQVFLTSNELSNFNFEEMSLMIGKILNHFSQ